MTTKIAQTHALIKFAETYGYLESLPTEKIAVIEGRPGLGKTTAGKYIASIFNCTFIEAVPGWTRLQMLNALNDALGFATAKSASQAFNNLIKGLKTDGRSLIIDEANHLVSTDSRQHGLLEVLRSIHDQTGICLILVGMEGLLNSIRQFEQFVDRVQFFVKLKPCDIEDGRALFQCYAPNLDIDEELLKYLHKQSKGKPRLIKRYIFHLKQHAELNDLTKLTRADMKDLPLPEDTWMEGS